MFLIGWCCLNIIFAATNQLKNNEEIGAIAGNVKVGNENTMLTKWQSIEYTTAQNFDRRAFDLINGITVVPGAIGAFKKEAIEKAKFEIITFVDDDAFLKEDYLAILVAQFKADTQIAAIGGKILLHFETIVPNWENKYLNSLLIPADQG